MDKKYLEIIVCPLCKGPLEHREKELICERDQLAFPIDDGVPMLLEHKARPLGNS